MLVTVSEKILDGKRVAAERLDVLSRDIAAICARGQIPPKLVVVLVGTDPASQVYVRNKAKKAVAIGMLSEVLTFEESLTPKELQGTIQRLNEDSSVHGILIQLPLPRQFNTLEVLSWVEPEKDVDGFHPVNMGRLLSGDLPPALPCTPAGILTLLKTYKVPIAGKHAVVVGRSNIVGKPVGLLLLQENATVTYCHSKTKNLGEMLCQADILVAAIGIPEMITADHVKPGVVVVDVGINRASDGKLVGDVAFEAVSPKASLITPVPGGVGPMTIATLMENTVRLYQKIHR